MKFIHIADIHIGARPDADFPWGICREKEIISNFHKMMDICNEEEIDLLLIAGDVFHKQPLIRELKEVNYCFQKLRKTQVVLIAGNHDYVGARSNYIGFDWNDNVHMLIDEDMDSIFFEDLNTEVYGFSYHTREIVEPRYDKVRPGCEERINILLAHGGNTKSVPMDRNKMLTNGFDYIAMGHFHKPQIFSDRMAYVGSFEPMDKNETGQRGYIIGDLSKRENESTININFISNSVRQYHKVELVSTQDTTNGALLDKARNMIQDLGKDDIFIFRIIGIRDTDIKFQLEDFYALGNVVEVIDEAVPDYDFDGLSLVNKDNIIGMYISRIKENATEDGIAQKALYYGIEALLGAKK